MKGRTVLAWLLAAPVATGVGVVAVIDRQPGWSVPHVGVGPSMLAACWAITGALLVTARQNNAVGWLVLLCGVLQGWSNVGSAYGGTLQGMFVANFAEGPKGSRAAVTGGTGRYRGASGESVSKIIPNTDTDVTTIRLD